MQRATTMVLGGLVLGAVGLLLVKGGPRAAPPPQRVSWSAALSPSSPPVPPMPLLSVPPLIAPSAVTPPTPAPVARLPANAPKVVRFGVVLVQYRGAQFADEGAPYKTEALARARQLAELARKDFKAAVKQGDPGSADDAGRIRRGILEPGPEVELFSLAPGAVSDPIDTPRGYWVVRRID